MANTEFRIRGNPLPDPHKPQPPGHNPQPDDQPAPTSPDSPDPAEPATFKDKVIAALKQVYDPEIPIDIYELGLIYEVNVDESTGQVDILMTLTTPNCPVAQDLPAEVRQAAQDVPEVTKANLKLTFDPPWSPERMSEAAKVHLGFM